MASTKNGIIYPDNYDEVADVPADMKVLAESVDGNIERINKNLDKNADELKNLQKDNTGNKTAIEAINKKNTEQDTNIQKNAKDIEANQNNIKALQVENAEVKAENERLRDDIKSIALTGEESGESIDLEDSSEARFNKFEIEGNHKQETRDGYNKFKPFESSDIVSANGTTVKIENEKITINGTCTKQWWCEIYYRLGDGTAVQTDKKENLDLSKTYTFGLQRISGDITQGYVNATVVIDENDKQIGGVAIATNNKNGTSKTFTGGNGIYRAYLYIPQNAVFNNLEFGVLIYEGSEAKDWEQYGATPSLKFSSKIKTVKDNVNVVVCNKNILKILGLGERWEYTEKGIKNLYANPGIKISQLNLKKGQTVEIGFLLLSKVNNDISFVNFVNDKTGVIASFANIQNYNVNTIYKKKYTATDDCTIKTVLYGNVNEEIFEFQLWAEYNQISNTYIKHQEQTITMPVQQDMLKEDYFDWVKEKEVHKWPELIFDGTENWLQSGNIYPTFYISPDEIASKFGIPTSLKALCNYFTQKSNIWGIDEIGFDTANLRQDHVDFRFCLGSNSTITTLEAWKNKLVEMYNSGNPLVLYFQIFTQDELDFTDEQKVVAKKIKETLHTYKNITHIYSTDETGPIMNVEYAKDPNTQNNNLQNQIDEIKQLISTTQTSAMLLDNLQKEVESEVE